MKNVKWSPQIWVTSFTSSPSQKLKSDLLKLSAVIHCQPHPPKLKRLKPSSKLVTKTFWLILKSFPRLTQNENAAISQIMLWQHRRHEIRYVQFQLSPAENHREKSNSQDEILKIWNLIKKIFPSKVGQHSKQHFKVETMCSFIPKWIILAQNIGSIFDRAASRVNSGNKSVSQSILSLSHIRSISNRKLTRLELYIIRQPKSVDRKFWPNPLHQILFEYALAPVYPEILTDIVWGWPVQSSCVKKSI